MTDSENYGAVRERKAELRREVLGRRALERDREEKSLAIGHRILALPDYTHAGTVAWFVGVGTEVMTLPFIETALEERRRVAVPWVADGDIRLFRLLAVDELQPAGFGLLEPAAELRSDPARFIPPEEVDFFVVPGVAFDRRGGRLGHGKGYYDRLLRAARPQVSRTGIGFDSQLVEAVPMGPGDVWLHRVVTELGVHLAAA